MLCSEEYGKDLASVQNLLKKHQLLEADVAAHEVSKASNKLLDKTARMVKALFFLHENIVIEGFLEEVLKVRVFLNIKYTLKMLENYLVYFLASLQNYV